MSSQDLVWPRSSDRPDGIASRRPASAARGSPQARERRDRARVRIHFDKRVTPDLRTRERFNMAAGIQRLGKKCAFPRHHQHMPVRQQDGIVVLLNPGRRVLYAPPEGAR